MLYYDVSIVRVTSGDGALTYLECECSPPCNLETAKAPSPPESQVLRQTSRVAWVSAPSGVHSSATRGVFYPLKLADTPLLTYKSDMKRDTLKTIAGLIIIGLIVVVTFLYGNAQRQDQNRRDQAAKQAQQQKANAQANKSTPSSQAAQPQAQPKVAASTPPATTPTPTATSVPDTGGTNSTMPDTGAGETALIPVSLILLGLFYLRRSRKALAVAVRKR